jgi:poly[ADP-ribose] polymerase 16
MDIPEKYYIVKNNDYVRVKYVFVYAEQLKIKRKNRLYQYFVDNKFALLLLSYSLLLILIGVLNSRVFHNYVKVSYKKITNFILGETSSAYE